MGLSVCSWFFNVRLQSGNRELSKLPKSSTEKLTIAIWQECVNLRMGFAELQIILQAKWLPYGTLTPEGTAVSWVPYYCAHTRLARGVAMATTLMLLGLCLPVTLGFTPGVRKLIMIYSLIAGRVWVDSIPNLPNPGPGQAVVFTGTNP